LKRLRGRNFDAKESQGTLVGNLGGEEKKGLSTTELEENVDIK